MRCPKCGYVSFDHMAKCKKCSRDLTDVRQALNLLDFKPAMPFLLGSLVGTAGQEGGYEAQGGLSLTQEAELEFTGLDMAESGPLEATVDMTSVQESADLEGLEVPGGAELESAPSYDLSLEDFDEEAVGGEQEPAGEEEGFLGLELEADEQPSAEDLSAAVDEPGLDVGDLDIEEPSPELEPTAEPEELDLGDLDIEEPFPELEPTAEPEELEDLELAEPPSEPAPAPETKELELELELSEEDLSALAVELEDQLTADSEAKKTDAEETDPELEEALLEMEKEL